MANNQKPDGPSGKLETMSHPDTGERVFKEVDTGRYWRRDAVAGYCLYEPGAVNEKPPPEQASEQPPPQPQSAQTMPTPQQPQSQQQDLAVEVARLMRVIEEQSRAVAQKDQEINHLRQQASRRDEQIALKDEQIEDLKAQLRELAQRPAQTPSAQPPPADSSAQGAEAKPWYLPSTPPAPAESAKPQQAQQPPAEPEPRLISTEEKRLVASLNSLSQKVGSDRSRWINEIKKTHANVRFINRLGYGNCVIGSNPANLALNLVVAITVDGKLYAVPFHRDLGKTPEFYDIPQEGSHYRIAVLACISVDGDAVKLEHRGQLEAH